MYLKTLITIYNTIISSVMKFLDRNFLFIEKVQGFLDYSWSQALARNKI